MKAKGSVILSFFVSILFFVLYFLKSKETMHLILGFTWLCLSICYYMKSKNKNS